MIEFLKTWSNQIIVAVIISTIIEMILPNRNNKKYIKMIIGIYVLFTIIQPIFTKFTGESIEISNFNYNKYFDKEIIKDTSQEFENSNSKLIEQAYINNIKNDIKTKIKQKGYEVSNIGLEVVTNEDDKNYGTIESIRLKISKIENEEEKRDNSNTIKIENVNINNSVNNIVNNVIDKSNISNIEKKDIIEYLANEYSIDKKNIIIY